MGDVIAGEQLDHYDLEELLARSGMASIFRAVDRRSGKVVALKVPHLQYESDVAFFERFRREEQIGQKLSHPNIVRVLPADQRSRTYLVMEFAEGRSLRAVMRERKRLPIEEALAIARQIGSALEYMHGQGVVHRDLKPDNVLVGEAGDVKLLDFGIAMDEAARRLTWFGLSPPIGTPDYMAPEQVRGTRGDARTDIYALGTLLYEMITGELPFTAGNAHAMMRAKLDDDPRPPRDLVADIPSGIDEIILRAIERSPRERYRTVREMLDDLNDPARVVRKDRSARRSTLLRRLRIPRRAAGPTLLVAAILGLLALIWKTGPSSRPRPHGPRTHPTEGAKPSADAGESR
jgi:serine/threonine-protein kinase